MKTEEEMYLQLYSIPPLYFCSHLYAEKIR